MILCFSAPKKGGKINFTRSMLFNNSTLHVLVLTLEN